MDVPLIWTSAGNVPVADLTYEKEWQDNEEFIIFAEWWKDSQGTIVKNNVHMYSKKGLPPVGGEQAKMA